MDMISIPGLMFGAAAWFTLRYVIFGFYTVAPNERAVKTSFGKAEQLQTTTLDNPMSESLRPEERERYKYPQVRVIPPGGPYFKWPWEESPSPAGTCSARVPRAAVTRPSG